MVTIIKQSGNPVDEGDAKKFLDEWNPNLYIDIKSTYTLKMDALNEFKSQNHRYYFRKDVLRAFHSDFQCSKKGVHYIEKYKILNLFN